jgi:hypothetical protein
VNQVSKYRHPRANTTASHVRSQHLVNPTNRSFAKAITHTAEAIFTDTRPALSADAIHAIHAVRENNTLTRLASSIIGQVP